MEIYYRIWTIWFFFYIPFIRPIYSDLNLIDYEFMLAFPKNFWKCSYSFFLERSFFCDKYSFAQFTSFWILLYLLSNKLLIISFGLLRSSNFCFNSLFYYFLPFPLIFYFNYMFDDMFDGFDPWFSIFCPCMRICRWP